MKINTQGVKDNMHNIAGVLFGFMMKHTGHRFNKDSRGSKWFSTTAANNAADGYVQWLPYVVFIK